MKRLLTVLLALGVSLTQNAGFVYAEETEENVEEITEETEIVEQDATKQNGDIETPETSDNYVTVKLMLMNTEDFSGMTRNWFMKSPWKKDRV